MTSIIVNGFATPGDGGGETEVIFDYGETDRDDLFTLNQLADLTDTHHKAHRVMVYDMNSDQKHRYDATGIAAVEYFPDSDTDRIYMFDQCIDGAFFFLLTVGDKFKAFHCEQCAKDFTDWFLVSQAKWKRTHHGALRQSAPSPKKSYQ